MSGLQNSSTPPLLNSLITLTGISKTFSSRGNNPADLSALQNIDLSAARNEMLVIMGPSGSGKSTLLKIIGGILTPTSGSVVIEGADLTKASDREKARFRNEKVGFVFQTLNLLPNLTA